jgi:hypothetical protein
VRVVMRGRAAVAPAARVDRVHTLRRPEVLAPNFHSGTVFLQPPLLRP